MGRHRFFFSSLFDSKNPAGKGGALKTTTSEMEVREVKVDEHIVADKTDPPVLDMRGRGVAKTATPKSENGAGGLFSAADAAETRRAKAWLESHFKRAEKAGGFTIDDVSITPVIAEIMLTCNTNNRKQRKTNILRFASAAEEGRWVPGASTIRFDKNRLLVDGQHRLQMVIAAARAAVMDVRFGVPPETRFVVDAHGKRTGGDVLTMEGYANGNSLAAAARLLNNCEAGQPRGNISIDNDIVIQFIETHPLLAESVNHGRQVARRFHTSTAAPAVAHYLFVESGAPVDAVDIFFTRLVDGLGITSKRDPIYVLRETLLKGKVPSGQSVPGYFSASALLGAFINAWNFYKNGKKTSRVLARDDKPFPTVERW